MSNIIPTQLFTDYSLVSPGDTIPSQSLLIPLSSLQGLTNSEADPASGDGREVLRIIVESAYKSLNNLDTASRPTKLTFAKAQSLPAAVGVDEIRQTYTFAFDVSFNPGDVNLVAE